MTLLTTLRKNVEKKDIYLGKSSWTDQIQFVETGSWCAPGFWENL